MTPLDCVFAAADALRANVLRSVLTALGVVIGVAAVVAMVAVGLGARARIEQAMADIGSNMLVIGNASRTEGGRQTGRGRFFSLTEGDAAALAQSIETIAVAAGSVGGAGRLVAGNRNWVTRLWGVTPEYFVAHNWSVAAGRPLTAADVGATAKVALLGRSVAEQLFAERDPLGEVIRIERVPFTVVGVLTAKGPDPWLGSDQDDLVLMPLSTAKRRIFGARQARYDLLGQITVKVASSEAVDATKAQVTALLRRRHALLPGEEDDFFVSDVTEALEARSESSRIMARLLAAIASISLLVGGIGIMNIMLVSVTERTREIGLRRALGARPGDILAQFATEAVMLSLIGGLIGIALGAAGSLLIAELAGWPVRLGAGVVVAAALFSAAVGLVFGFVPARQAARLDPIEALRRE